MFNKRVLAFDFGASNGRAMLSEYDGDRIKIQEVHRFNNNPVAVNNTLYWDILHLFYEIKQGISKAMQLGGFDAIGIDTWAIDFALIDKNGNMLSNPVHYRDTRTMGIDDNVFKVISKDVLYSLTGIQHMRFNTIYQLAYLAEKEPEMLDRAEKMLLIPDLIAYFLTGKMYGEVTNASTTNIFNSKTDSWCFDICRKLKIKESIFPSIIKSGEIYGTLTDEICEELSCDKVPVIAVATHDTASAVVSAPAKDKNFVYISCGTWSLFGIENDEPIINDEAMNANFTNEIGYDNKIRFLKNIMGLWLIQESRRQWIREGSEVGFDVLEKEALEAEPFKCYINTDSSEFEVPGNMPERIIQYCKNTGQYVPQTRGEIMRCIYQSLALKYRYTFDKLQSITGKKYDSINMVGGGIKDTLLCKMAANACNVIVFAGPVEATVMGNIAVQYIALGEIKDLAQARSIISKSTDIKVYKPIQANEWEKAYQNYLSLI